MNSTGRDGSMDYFECFHFEMTERAANELLIQVLQGVKQAASSSLLHYRAADKSLPQAGDLSIITDWSGVPRCVIETTAVTILPFKDITFDICQREGEDDSLESWQTGHVSFFTRDGMEAGYEFTWDMPVVFEDFKVVYR